MLQRARKLVGGSNAQEIVRGALRGNGTGPRRIGEGLCPCRDVCVVSFGIDFELLPEVGIQRC